MVSCHDKNDKTTSSHAPAALNDMYVTIKLPFNVVDSAIQEKGKGAAIGLPTFLSFFPDSMFQSVFEKDRKIILKAVGKIEQKNKESYFLTLAENKTKSALYVSVFDSNRHVVSMPLIVNEAGKKDFVNSASIDKKLTILINKEWTVKNDLFYNRIIYAYNNVGVFTTVLTETNEKRTNIQQAILNPLDTFPKRNKLSGDYTNGPRNRLSVRDGSSSNDYLFFIHFESPDKEEPCSGEIKANFKMLTETTAEYASQSDPCGVSFTFNGLQIEVKENGSCGNYRDIKCFFNNTFTKKKDLSVKPKEMSKKPR